jgi:hypothetical protein
MAEDTMRAMCGSIIAAGALIGLGLASIGIGTRYQNYVRNDPESGDLLWVRFSHMDSSLIFTLVVLVCALIIGLGIAFVGLALHHHRRQREWEHHVNTTKAQQRVTV